MPLPELLENKDQPRNAVAENQLVLAHHAQDLAREHRQFGGSSNDSNDLLDMITDMKVARGLTAAGTLLSSGCAGFLREGATAKDLAFLRHAQPQPWADASRFNESTLGSLRYELQRTKGLGPGTIAPQEEALMNIGARGALKGILTGVAGVGATCAVDMMFFSDTPRTGMSTMVDLIGMPMIGYAPINPGLKVLGMAAIHTAGRLYDRYLAKEIGL
jgi:hypothetical protein